jgi:hypothetical protein
VQRVCAHRLQPLHWIHCKFSPGGEDSGVQNIQLLSCCCICPFDPVECEGDSAAGGGGEISFMVDLGVGMALVETCVCSGPL